MAKASENWEKADGNPEKFMESMMSTHEEMFPEPSAPEPEVNISAPVVRGDPTLAAFKAEKKEEIRSLKKEAEQCRKELKAMKKATKLCAKVVGHLDMDEESEQVAGSCCLKTWK